MNALSSPQVADFVNDHLVATYLKVGTFQIVGDRKVGGNVASYICVPDGGVLHAIPGPANAQTFLREARWAREIYRKAITAATDLSTGAFNKARFADAVQKAHLESFLAAAKGQVPRLRLPQGQTGGASNDFQFLLPAETPHYVNRQDQAHWLLARRGGAPLDEVYPIMWTDILRERLSSLPVAAR